MNDLNFWLEDERFEVNCFIKNVIAALNVK